MAGFALFANEEGDRVAVANYSVVTVWEKEIPRPDRPGIYVLYTSSRTQMVVRGESLEKVLGTIREAEQEDE